MTAGTGKKPYGREVKFHQFELIFQTQDYSHASAVLHIIFLFLLACLSGLARFLSRLIYLQVNGTHWKELQKLQQVSPALRIYNICLLLLWKQLLSFLQDDSLSHVGVASNLLFCHLECLGACVLKKVS